jgi:segregation and condensation protein A
MLAYEKIMQLAEAKKSDLSAISLAEITNDFIQYVETLDKNIEPEIIADFVVVAAKLMLIKSKALLPNLILSEDEEAEIKDLETRLAFYQNAKPAREAIKNFWRKEQASFSRPLFLNLNRIFYPPPRLTANQVAGALSSLGEELKILAPERQAIKKRIISVEEKTRFLLSRLKKAGRQNMSALAQNQSREELVAVFLAVLFLFKNQLISFQQDGNFSDIIIQS